MIIQQWHLLLRLRSLSDDVYILVRIVNILLWMIVQFEWMFVCTALNFLILILILHRYILILITLNLILIVWIRMLTYALLWDMLQEIWMIQIIMKMWAAQEYVSWRLNHFTWILSTDYMILWAGIEVHILHFIFGGFKSEVFIILSSFRVTTRNRKAFACVGTMSHLVFSFKILIIIKLNFKCKNKI